MTPVIVTAAHAITQHTSPANLRSAAKYNERKVIMHQASLRAPEDPSEPMIRGLKRREIEDEIALCRATAEGLRAVADEVEASNAV